LAEERIFGQKVAIVGAGFVGTTLAYSLLINGTVSKIIFIDIKKEKAEGEVMDLNHGLPFAHPVKMSVGNFSDCKDADIVVIVVDKGKRIEASRLELAEGNYEILKEIIPKIKAYNDKCIFLVVTNPS
jgi:L-lactate dehydrogenase